MAKKDNYLNELVGSLGVFYIKLHQLHWYVEGTGFFILHEKFEELYDEVTADLDEVAERLLILDMKPISTLGEFLKVSLIKEEPYAKKLKALDMVKIALDDYKVLKEKVEAGYELFEGDEVTTDMLVGLNEKFDKHIWMLSTYLK